MLGVLRCWYPAILPGPAQGITETRQSLTQTKRSSRDHAGEYSGGSGPPLTACGVPGTRRPPRAGCVFHGNFPQGPFPEPQAPSQDLLGMGATSVSCLWKICRNRDGSSTCLDGGASRAWRGPSPGLFRPLRDRCCRWGQLCTPSLWGCVGGRSPGPWSWAHSAAWITKAPRQ